MLDTYNQNIGQIFRLLGLCDLFDVKQIVKVKSLRAPINKQKAFIA